MKNTTQVTSSHPYLAQSNMGTSLPPVDPIQRLRDLSVTECGENAPEPERDYCFGTMVHGLSELDSQLDSLRAEVLEMRGRLRVFLPDHLFDSVKGESCGPHYTAAGNLNSPVLQAIATLANSVTGIRKLVSEVSYNVVN